MVFVIQILGNFTHFYWPAYVTALVFLFFNVIFVVIHFDQKTRLFFLVL